MSWESAIRGQQQSDEIVRLRGELERALERIHRLETKLGEADVNFFKREQCDSTSPYWLQSDFYATTSF